MTYSLQALLACITTSLLIVWMRRPAERLGLIDHPGGRKRHDSATPLTGGLAITLSLFVALAFSLPAMRAYTVLFAVIAVQATVGILDDRGGVSAHAKFGAQVLAATLMACAGGHFLHSLGDLFGTGRIELMHWSIPLTVFAAVAVINAINTFDGVDGLAGGLVLVILAYFTLFAWTLGDASAVKFLVVLSGALLGFLFFNAPLPWRRTCTFMGDTGSQVLGIVVVWFSIEFTQQRGAALPPVTMLWVVGIVLLDFFTVTARRMLRGRNPAAPDRLHIHHLLLRRGLTPAQTTAVLILANGALGAIGTAGWWFGWPESLMFAEFLVVATAYLAVFLVPSVFMRLGRRPRHAPHAGSAQRPSTAQRYSLR